MTDIRLFTGVRISAGRIDGDGELRHIGAFQSHYFADSLLLHLIDAQHRVHGQVGALYLVEFGLDLLLGRVDDHGRTLAEHQFLDLDEAKQAAMAYFAGVDLVHLSLIYEENFKNVTRGHLVGSKRSEEHTSELQS